MCVLFLDHCTLCVTACFGHFWGTHRPDPGEEAGGGVGPGAADELHVLLAHVPAFFDSLYGHDWSDWEGETTRMFSFNNQEYTSL